MNYTKEQFDALAPYEGNFGTAIRSKWSPYPGAEALRLIHRIFTSATGDRRRLNSACSVCVLHLLRDAGKLYFADKEEYDKQAREFMHQSLAAAAAKKMGDDTPKPKKKRTTKKKTEE